MKYIILALILTFSFVGCNSNNNENPNIKPKLVVGENLSDLHLNDQNEKPQTISKDTKVVVFSFSKKVGHMCNEFLESKKSDFLTKNNAVYIADVSPAPSIIKTMFILPDLKELKFPILLINDDTLSQEYSKGVDKDSIIVVTLENQKIKSIKNLKSTKELEKLFN